MANNIYFPLSIMCKSRGVNITAESGIFCLCSLGHNDSYLTISVLWSTLIIAQNVYNSAEICKLCRNESNSKNAIF